MLNRDLTLPPPASSSQKKGLSTPRITSTQHLGKAVNHPFPHTCGVALQISLFPVYSGCENSRLGHRFTLEEGPTHSNTHTHTHTSSLSRTLYISLENVCVHVYSEAEVGTTHTTHIGAYKSIRTPTTNGFKAKLHSVKAMLKETEYMGDMGTSRTKIPSRDVASSNNQLQCCF